MTKHTKHGSELVPGRCCPMGYRYSAAALRAAPAIQAETLYVIGGLYGNIEALREILAMKRQEERQGRRVTLLFNGDFNWFDVDDEGFVEVNETVLAHEAIKGNVEEELEADEGVGCGCAYPLYVDQGTVDYSNAIIERLQECARHHPQLVRRLRRLPMLVTASVGGERVGIIHGDAESLAGWGFAVEAMEPLDQTLRAQLGCDTDAAVTTGAQVVRYFEQADVRIFASSHTCLPFMQEYAVDDKVHVLVNNGSAGMPNFRNVTAGLITRISSERQAPSASVFGTVVGDVRVDAVPVAYDQTAWLCRFLESWPEGSPAHQSYFTRMIEGPAFEPAQAMRLRSVERGKGHAAE